MIACSFPYQDKQAFIKNGLSGLTGSGVEITPAITRLLEKSWDQIMSQCSKQKRLALAAVAPYEQSEKESAAKCPDLRSASQNYKAVQNITNYLKSEIKKKPKRHSRTR